MSTSSAQQQASPRRSVVERYFFAVDFAPRFSALVVMDEQGNSLDHFVHDAGPESDGFDAHAISNSLWLERVKDAYPNPERIVIEDVSHMMVKPAQVLRLQGALRSEIFRQFGLPCEMVYPQVWQNFFGWKKTPGITSKGFAKFACTVLGYKIAGTRGKQTVDVRDALLIGRWAVANNKDER